MKESNSSNLPDWNEIFRLRPDLDPPGYREAVESLRNSKITAEQERMAEIMRQIHKQRLSTKNKNRSARSRLAAKDSVNSFLSVDKNRS
jgi:hypothetical protein